MKTLRLVIRLPLFEPEFVKPLPFCHRRFVKLLPFVRQTTPVFHQHRRSWSSQNRHPDERFAISPSHHDPSPKIQRFGIKTCKQIRAVALAGKNRLHIRRPQERSRSGTPQEKTIERSIDRDGTDVPDFASSHATRRPESPHRLAEPRLVTSMRAPRRELSPATSGLSTTPGTGCYSPLVAASCFGSRLGAAHRSQRRRRHHARPIGLTHHCTVPTVASAKGSVSDLCRFSEGGDWRRQNGRSEGLQITSMMSNGVRLDPLALSPLSRHGLTAGEFTGL